MNRKLVVIAALAVVLILAFVACQPVTMPATQTEANVPVATGEATEEAVAEATEEVGEESEEEGHTHEAGEEAHSHDADAEMVEGTVPLMDNLGSHHHAISTDNEMAQAY